jgi:hypothetical protein
MEDATNSPQQPGSIRAIRRDGFFAVIPPAARWFGLTGAIPFMVLSFGGEFLSPAHQSYAQFSLMAYGAVILSFLGGVHWGRAIVPPEHGRLEDKTLWVPLAISVTPSLFGWGALLVPRFIALPILAASFAAMLLIDLFMVRIGSLPEWYGNLLVILSAVVVASLLFAWV